MEKRPLSQVLREYFEADEKMKKKESFEQREREREMAAVATMLM